MIIKFYRVLLNHPKTVIILFVVAAIVCAFLQKQVSVNYDMKDYLPEETASTESLKKMEEEFSDGIPNARVMVNDVTIAEALEYKEKLLACEGVSDVTWLDDVADVYQPLSFTKDEYVDAYYKDGTALFSVTVDEDQKIAGVKNIRSVIGYDNSMSGEAVSTAYATVSTINEIGRIAGIAVVFVLFILCLATRSWMEPLIIMTCIGVAILLNMGTNIISGEISFVTNAAGNILQLALVLDYTIFLMHRYEEYHGEFDDPKEAIIMAIKKSSSSIVSSGLAACFGFLALTLMRFTLGVDLGLVLAKSILIGMVTVFLLMPVLILVLNNLMNKTWHKRLLPDFGRFGKFVTKIMIPCVVVLVILIVPSYLASGANSYYYGSSNIFDTDTVAGKDIEKIENVYGKNDTYALLVPVGDSAKEEALSAALHEIKEVDSIISYVDTVGAEIPLEYINEDLLAKLMSENFSRMVINVNTDFEGEETFALVEEIRDTAEEYYPGSYYLAGEGVSTYDLMDTITADDIKVNMAAIIAVSLVLLLVMRSISLPIILVLCIETSIWMNLGIPYFGDSIVFYIAHLIICAIQLGATMDFAILMTDRYIEARNEMGKKEAVIFSTKSTVTSIMVNGLTLTVAGFLLGFMTSHGILAQLGFFLGRGAVLSLIIVFTALPGCLYLFDGLIRRTTLGCKNFVLDTKMNGVTFTNAKEANNELV